jgi:hypothetical protein
LDFENRNEKKTTAATSFFDWTLVQHVTGELGPGMELGKVMEISQVIEHVQEIQLDQVKAKKQVKLWSSEAFFTTTPQEFGFDQSKIELDLGIRTFFDEYALLNPRKKYTKYGNKGWKNQNSVRTKISCERFVESLKKQKMNPTKLLDTTLLGRKFYADEKTANWIKIDSIVLGNSKKYGYKSGVEKNIGKLLEMLYEDELDTNEEINPRKKKIYTELIKTLMFIQLLVVIQAFQSGRVGISQFF